MKILITIIALSAIAILVYTSYKSEYIAKLTDESVNKDSHFELNAYTKANYPSCYNGMYSHLKWPERFKRPSCKQPS